MVNSGHPFIYLHILKFDFLCRFHFYSQPSRLCSSLNSRISSTNRSSRMPRSSLLARSEECTVPRTMPRMTSVLCSFFSGYTAKGLPLKYTVKGGELFFNRKEKSITRATVMEAFHKARGLQKTYGFVSGPKKLGTFGASYLYAVFLRIGVCSKEACEG